MSESKPLHTQRGRIIRRLVAVFVAPILVVSATLAVSTPIPVGATESPPPTYLLQWGSLGTGNGQFDGPRGVAVHGAGNVYVADLGNHRVEKFDGSGTFLTSWGSFGSGNGQFDSPTGVAVDGAGNVYVADNGHHRIEKFSAAPFGPTFSVPPRTRPPFTLKATAELGSV